MDPVSQPSQPRPAAPARPLPFLLLALAVALVFANTLRGGLHLDDVYRIGDWTRGSGNPELERVHPIWRHFLDPGTSTTLPSLEQYRPLLPLTLSLSHAASDALGLDRLVGLHLGSLLIHFAGVAFLYLLFLELLSTSRVARAREGPSERVGARAALVAALIYAVHPVSGVAVNYLCARDLLLMQAFAAAGLWVYVRMRRRGASAFAWLAALACVALSLVSKTNALVVPLVVLAYELLLAPSPTRDLTWGPKSAARWRAAVLHTAPFAALSVLFYVSTKFVLGFSDAAQLLIDRPPWEYPLTQAREHLLHYLRNAVAPFWLRPLPYVLPAGGEERELSRALLDPGVWAGSAVILGSLYLSWRWREKRPLAAFCILGYWLWMALTSSVLPMRSLATDYRQMAALPYLVLFAVVVATPRLSERARRFVAGAALAAFAAVSVFHHNPVWRDNLSLWGRSVGVGHSGTFRAHMNFGQGLMGSDPERAEKHLRIALEMSPGDIFSHINLGLLLLRGERKAEGLESVERAVQLAPNWAITRYWLGQAYEMLGRAAESAAESMRAADLQPDHPRYLYAAGRSAQWVQRYDRSAHYLGLLHQLSPPMGESLFLEAFAMQQTGRRGEAIDRYRRFLESAPGHAQALFNLAHALMEEGRSAEAVELFQRSLEADPTRNEVHHWLARCYEQLGDMERAAEEDARYASGG